MIRYIGTGSGEPMLRYGKKNTGDVSGQKTMLPHMSEHKGPNPGHKAGRVRRPGSAGYDGGDGYPV